jgi:tRNA C32,U32 (ribose-2'-O)-methylase TrmJ
VSVHEYLERITPFGFSGACLVGVGDEIVSNAGYGFAVRAEEVPNTAETVFSLGSVTKQFTAAAILSSRSGERSRSTTPSSASSRTCPATRPASRFITC